MDLHRVLFNDHPVTFLLEVLFRTAVMFTALLIVLRLAGKRGVKQLSVFEMVIIIALGSAAGDPMFYDDVGLVPAIVVFIVVISLYRAVTWLTGKKVWFERLIEGKPEHLIEEGKFSFVKFEKETLAHDEFFAELRLRSVEHLGQVRHAYLETNGDISVFLYEDHQVKYGLPITPQLFNRKSKYIREPGIYSCTYCGHTLELHPGSAACPVCRNDVWVASINSRRIA